MQDAKNRKKNCHLSTIAQLCQAISSQLRHVSTIGKKLVTQQYLLHMSPQYGELQPTSGWDQSGSLGHPSKFQWVSHLGSITAATSLNRSQPNFARLWPSSGLVHYIYIFGVSCPIPEFCQVQNSLCILQVLRSRILVALLYGTSAVGTSQTLRRWAQGATYIRQGDHHVGHWPHSSYDLHLCTF